MFANACCPRTSNAAGKLTVVKSFIAFALSEANAKAPISLRPSAICTVSNALQL